MRAGHVSFDAGKDGRFDLGRHDLLPILGLLVTRMPRDAEDVGEHALGEAVAAHEVSPSVAEPAAG